jgi:patatin-like phospholipase/acyl hydrolase
MKVLVISRDRKATFTGEVAKYLNEKDNTYDIFVGTSVGSLLISHLALKKVTKLTKYFNVPFSK